MVAGCDVSYYIESLQQVLFWALFVYGFAVPVALHCLLKQAFLEIGEDAGTWVHRLEMFQRVYSRWLTCERLEANAKFRTALTLVKAYRNLFLIVVANYILLMICKLLGF
jgi:hypothetical protein